MPQPQICVLGENMAHEKLKSLGVMLAVFGCVAAISWAVVNSHAHGELFPSLLSQEQARDAALAYIQANHPETAPFMQPSVWTGGTQELNHITTFQGGGWAVKVHADATSTFTVTATFHIEPAQGQASVPYAVTWQGACINSQIAENSYTFTQ
jgi:hypothetical protein